MDEEEDGTCNIDTPVLLLLPDDLSSLLSFTSRSFASALTAAVPNDNGGINGGADDDEVDGTGTIDTVV